MKPVTLDHFIEERILENKNLFSEEDFKFINKNQECIKKIYLIGFTNAKECYER